MTRSLNPKRVGPLHVGDLISVLGYLLTVRTIRISHSTVDGGGERGEVVVHAAEVSGLVGTAIHLGNLLEFGDFAYLVTAMTVEVRPESTEARITAVFPPRREGPLEVDEGPTEQVQ